MSSKILTEEISIADKIKGKLHLYTEGDERFLPINLSKLSV